MTIELKSDTKEMHAKLTAAGKITIKDGVATPVDKAYLTAVASETLTEEIIKEVGAKNSAFAAAQLQQFQEAALPVFKKDANLESVELVVPTVGRDYFSFTIERKKQFPGVNGAEPTTTFGHASVKHVIHDAKNIGDLRKVRTSMAEAYKASLGK